MGPGSVIERVHSYHIVCLIFRTYNCFCQKKKREIGRERKKGNSLFFRNRIHSYEIDDEKSRNYTNAILNAYNDRKYAMYGQRRNKLHVCNCVYTFTYIFEPAHTITKNVLDLRFIFDAFSDSDQCKITK